MAERAVEGEGFRLLTGPIFSPTLANQIQALLKCIRSQVISIATASRNVLAGSMQPSGSGPNEYRLEGRIVLFAGCRLPVPSFPGSARYTHDYRCRRIRFAMNRPVCCRKLPRQGESRAPALAGARNGRLSRGRREPGVGGVRTLRVELHPGMRLWRAVADDLKAHAGLRVIAATAITRSSCASPANQRSSQLRNGRLHRTRS